MEVKMSYKLAIFDMDGTTLNTIDDLAASLNYALKECGLPLRTTKEVLGFVGNGIRLLIERGVPSGTSIDVTDKVFQYFSDHYKIHCADKTKPYDGIINLLETLRKMNILTAVVSNKADYAVQSLCSQYFKGLFSVAAGEKTGIRKKPAPDAVNAILQELSINRTDAVYIGDSEVDIETAKNAGMDCIAVEWGFRERTFLKEHGAKIIVSDTQQLLHLITQ